MRKFLHYASIALLTAVSVIAARADIPAGYYNSLNGKKDAELKTAAFNVIRNFTSVLLQSAVILPSHRCQAQHNLLVGHVLRYGC